MRSEICKTIWGKIVTRLLLTHNWRRNGDWKSYVEFPPDFFLGKVIPVEGKLGEAKWLLNFMVYRKNEIIVPQIMLLGGFIRVGNIEPELIGFDPDHTDRLCEGVTFTEADLTDDRTTNAFANKIDRTVTALIKARYADFVTKNSSRIEQDQQAPPAQGIT